MMINFVHIPPHYTAMVNDQTKILENPAYNMISRNQDANLDFML